jgi:hypothetical protein
MNDFSVELRDLIDKWRDHPGVPLQEMVDALECAAEEIVEEIDVRADA